MKSRSLHLFKQRADAGRDDLEEELPRTDVTFDVQGYGERHPASPTPRRPDGPAVGAW